MELKDYNLKEDEETSLSAPSMSSKKDTIVFFLTTPHDQPNRGDTSYVQSIIEACNRNREFSNYVLEHITEETILNNRAKLYRTLDLNQNVKNRTVYSISDSEIRKDAVSNIILYIKQRSANFDFKILHLQLREPETGCAVHSSDLVRFKQVINKIIITCHEWGYYTSVSIQPNYLAKQLDRIRLADHTIFLNEADRKQAI